jgi:glycine oxidase
MEPVLIVGGGLAGVSLAERMIERNVPFLLMDNLSNPSSTAVATGMYNPIVFKRLAKSWLVDDLLPELHVFYERLEQKLGTSLNTDISLKKSIGSSDYGTFWNRRKIEVEFSPYLGEISKGYGQVKKAGIIACEALSGKYRDQLLLSDQWKDELFDFSKLQVKPTLEYDQKKFSSIVFCEGAYAAENPFFNWLPFKLCKGEWIVIQTEKSLGESVLNHVINFIPLGENRYKLSSTYEWEDLSWNKTEKGKLELCSAFEKCFDLPYAVIEHSAGVRPTVGDRRPFLGSHPRLKNLFIFNGLGTKGVMLAPLFSKHLADYILDQKPLMKEVDIKRHIKRFYHHLEADQNQNRNY